MSGKGIMVLLIGMVIAAGCGRGAAEQKTLAQLNKYLARLEAYHVLKGYYPPPGSSAWKLAIPSGLDIFTEGKPTAEGYVWSYALDPNTGRYIVDVVPSAPMPGARRFHAEGSASKSQTDDYVIRASECADTTCAAPANWASQPALEKKRR